MAFDPANYLNDVGDSEDADINIGLAALALSAHLHEGISTERYINHLDKIVSRVEEAYAKACADGGEDTLGLRINVLKNVVAEEFGYGGDQDNYDDLQNASLIRVIDRAKGLPVAISILCMHAAHSLGWDVHGLNFPGHFICRIQDGPQSLIFDPYNNFQILNAPELRALIKGLLGTHAELSSAYYEPVSNREVLLRLQNNLKLRMIEVEDYEGALKIVKLMKKIAPNDYRLLFDFGVLLARTEQPQAAIEALSAYVEQAPNDRDRHDAALFLQQIKDSLH